MNARVALCSALAAGVLTGCAAGQEPEQSAPAPAPSAAPSAAPTPRPSVRSVEVSCTDGQVGGTSGREAVPLGEQVVLRISSDVAEQVHVHGYDVEAAVPAGGSVDIPLTADVPGVFEVELHDSGKVLFQLRVA